MLQGGNKKGFKYLASKKKGVGVLPMDDGWCLRLGEGDNQILQTACNIDNEDVVPESTVA